MTTSVSSLSRLLAASAVLSLAALTAGPAAAAPRAAAPTSTAAVSTADAPVVQYGIGSSFRDFACKRWGLFCD